MACSAANPRWTVSRTNREYVEYLSKHTGLSLPVAQTLINRGIRTPEQIAAFLAPGLSQLADPYELQGMQAAVTRISSAIRSRERILVHGDYDADGVTATAIIVEALRWLGADVTFFIPDREHGYGMGPEGINKAREAGASLIVTVDCGITAFDAVSSANALGIDVVVTDHHEPLYRTDNPRALMLPEAAAIIDPKAVPGDLSCTELSGAGVAFKLAQALLGNNIEKCLPLIDLAALGTAADVVPLTGENRVLVKNGCNLIFSGARAGIRALKQAAGVRSNGMKVSTLQFMIIPRINAAGRIADASDVVKLLLTTDEAEAASLAEWLNKLNIARQSIGESVFDEAMESIRKSSIAGAGDGAIVAAAEGWHPGVLGIVAARIADIYYRPAFILSIKDGVAKGSARSIPQFDVHEGLGRCSAILRSYGGHKQAAGLSLAASDLGPFQQAISRILMETVTADDLCPVLRLDAPLRISEINSGLLGEIAGLEPFGCGNEEPLFGARGLEISRLRLVGGRHLKMHLRQDGRSMDSIGFDLGGMLDQFIDGDSIDAAFLPVLNDWEGGRSIQLNLKAVRAAENGI
jgi:single-stranded-DNA-specific exonuclease